MKNLVPGTLVDKAYNGEPLRRYVCCWTSPDADELETVMLYAPFVIISSVEREKLHRNVTILGSNGRLGYVSDRDCLRWEMIPP